MTNKLDKKSILFDKPVEELAESGNYVDKIIDSLEDELMVISREE